MPQIKRWPSGAICPYFIYLQANTGFAMLRTVLIIGAGSFAGGIARYLVSRLIQTGTSSAFPWGTFAVNIIGCFLIGLLYGLFERNRLPNTDLRMFLTVGFCGGFTTFSTFVHENYSLFNNDNFLHFSMYSILSFGIGLLAAHLGHLAVRG